MKIKIEIFRLEDKSLRCRVIELDGGQIREIYLSGDSDDLNKDRFRDIIEEVIDILLDSDIDDTAIFKR